MNAAAGRRMPGVSGADRFQAHERARADMTVYDSFRHEALVGDRDSVPRDVEATCQLTRGWEPLAWTKAAVQDRVEQLPINAG